MDKAYYAQLQDGKYFVYTFQNYQDLDNIYHIYSIESKIVEVATKLFSALDYKLPINSNIMDLIIYARVIKASNAPHKDFFMNAFATELVENILISNFDGTNYSFSFNKDFNITMDDLYKFFRQYDTE